MLIKKDYLIAEVQDIQSASNYVDLIKSMVFLLLLFKLRKSMVTFFNEVIIISGEQMERLSRHFFSHSLEVIVKRFNVMAFIYRFTEHFYQCQISASAVDTGKNKTILIRRFNKTI